MFVSGLLFCMSCELSVSVTENPDGKKSRMAHCEGKQGSFSRSGQGSNRSNWNGSCTTKKKVRNILRESSCHGEDFSSKISKESLSSEQSNELTYLQNENKIFKDQLETQSKHKKKMQNMKRLFESNSQQINNQLSIVREATENQTLEIASYMS